MWHRLQSVISVSSRSLRFSHRLKTDATLVARFYNKILPAVREFLLNLRVNKCKAKSGEAVGRETPRSKAAGRFNRHGSPDPRGRQKPDRKGGCKNRRRTKMKDMFTR
jgi:hypothetical protein